MRPSHFGGEKFLGIEAYVDLLSQGQVQGAATADAVARYVGNDEAGFLQNRIKQCGFEHRLARVPTVVSPTVSDLKCFAFRRKHQFASVQYGAAPSACFFKRADQRDVVFLRRMTEIRA
jgi:hypothetical protein